MTLVYSTRAAQIDGKQSQIFFLRSLHFFGLLSGCWKGIRSTKIGKLKSFSSSIRSPFQSPLYLWHKFRVFPKNYWRLEKKAKVKMLPKIPLWGSGERKKSKSRGQSYKKLTRIGPNLARLTKIRVGNFKKRGTSACKPISQALRLFHAFSLIIEDKRLFFKSHPPFHEAPFFTRKNIAKPRLPAAMSLGLVAMIFSKEMTQGWGAIIKCYNLAVTLKFLM